jgi:hypothetical protein
LFDAAKECTDEAMREAYKGHWSDADKREMGGGSS